MLGLFMEAASEWAENEKSTAAAQPAPAPSKKVKKRQKPQDSGESSGIYSEKMSTIHVPKEFCAILDILSLQR